MFNGGGFQGDAASFGEADTGLIVVQLEVSFRNIDRDRGFAIFCDGETARLPQDAGDLAGIGADLQAGRARSKAIGAATKSRLKIKRTTSSSTRVNPLEDLGITNS